MAMTQNFIAVGVFHDAEQARHAIDELKRAGYSENEIGFLARASATESEDDTMKNATTGAVEGGVIGGVLGAAAALLIPGFGPAIAGGILLATFGAAGIGALAGTLIGTLVSIGVPEEEAHHYQRELEKGHTIVTVKATSGYDDVLAIMRNNGAKDAKIRYSEFNAEPPLRPYGSSLPPEGE
jgi:Heat induced stress protein YflT